MTTIDHVRIPAKLLETLAGLVGTPLTIEAASTAADAVRLEEWTQALAQSCRRAGLKPALVTIETAAEFERLTSLATPAVTRLGDRWIVVLGGNRAVEVRLFDALGDRRLSMTGTALETWLEHHGATRPVQWVAVEARMMLASTEHPPSENIRLIRTLRLERNDIAVALVFGAAMAATALAVPIAAQALVTTVTKTLLLQPLIMLGLMLLIALIAVGILQITQIVVAERIHRRIWVRSMTDWVRRMPRTTRRYRFENSNHELCNRWHDTVLLQKDVVSLVVDGTSLTLTTGASLLLLAFYHPWLLAFDVVLILGIVGVIASGWGAGARAIHESDCKYEMFAWMDDVAGGRLIFADAKGRAYADHRSEMFLRRWLAARGRYYTAVLREISSGVALQVIATVGILSLGGWLVIERQLTLGQLVAASVLVSTVGSGISRLGRQLDPIYEAVAAVATWGKTIDAELEVEGGILLPDHERPMAVELHEQTRNDELILSLAPGERLALLGTTGSHSRVLDMLYGLYKQETFPMNARLDGLETHVLDLESLRSQVALVRGFEVVWASVRDNLEVGQACDDNTLLEVLELVGLRERVFELPKKLDEWMLSDYEAGPLDENETRRLVLARALIAEPRLLCIDRGLDSLGLDPHARKRLHDWVFDRRRPWTIVVATDDPELHARCDQRVEIPHC